MSFVALFHLGWVVFGLIGCALLVIVGTGVVWLVLFASVVVVVVFWGWFGDLRFDPW